MDGSTLEHSDSDSGESWTILESTPSYADDALDGTVVDPCAIEGFAIAAAEKDDDTDGISIISDSEPESVAPCEPCEPGPERGPGGPPADPPPILSADPVSPNKQHDHNESIRDEDFLGDNTGKLKTYVHRRNKRLSTVLNIIVLGSVITAAGVAIGHMWGARHDCAHSASSVNKILSNLYKLQEENAFLRDRLRALSLAGPQRPPPADRLPPNKHKCKKLFEESLSNKNADKLTKCVDNETGEKLPKYLTQPDYEKEFLHDIDKLKHVYQQNKSWLDDEVAKRLKQEAHNLNDMKNKLKSEKFVKLNEQLKCRRNENLKRQLASEPAASTETVINVTEPAVQPLPRIVEVVDEKPETKISYADSLKSSHKVVKRDTNEASFVAPKDRIKKKKPRKEFDSISENSLADEVSMKDDRYVSPKYKPERKKHDRQKMHKKQKRRNKYEQWEMKGGYLKDYDDFSIPSVAENEYVVKITDKNRPSLDFERNNYMTQFVEVVEKKSADSKDSGDKTEASNETVKRENPDNWYEKRAALRSEARKRLELELFGENSMNAQWYFRRARRRHHCRANQQNQTRRSNAARRQANLNNYKTKH